MSPFKAVSIGEREELEPLLCANPEIIEDGLVILGRQLQTDSGPLDILGVDSDRNLVVVELKNEAEDGHLDQGLRYYDWCRQNISWIASAYAQKSKINTDASPRLVLIAPAFTETVKRIAKYVDVELDLIEYHAFQNEKGERGVICTPIDFGETPEPPEIPSIPRMMDYFRSDDLKKLFAAILEELKAKEVEIRPKQNLWATGWYRGKRFMYLGAKRGFLAIEVLTPDGNWSDRIRVSTQHEWEQAVRTYVEKYMQYLERRHKGCADGA